MSKKHHNVLSDVDEIMLSAYGFKRTRASDIRLLGSIILWLFEDNAQFGVNTRREKKIDRMNLTVSAHYWLAHGNHYEINVKYNDELVFDAYYNWIPGAKILTCVKGGWANPFKRHLAKVYKLRQWNGRSRK